MLSCSCILKRTIPHKLSSDLLLTAQVPDMHAISKPYEFLSEGITDFGRAPALTCTMIARSYSYPNLPGSAIVGLRITSLFEFSRTTQITCDPEVQIRNVRWSVQHTGQELEELDTLYALL